MLNEEKQAINLLENLSEYGLCYNITEEYQETIKIVLNYITKLQKQLEFQEIQIQNYVEELKKYDYRNIKINEENKIKSPSFTKEQLDLMNLGIALYIGIPKLLKDENEDVDI